MLKKIELTNFKCFPNNEFNLKELNIFTGLNSSGKSTLIQSILLPLQNIRDNIISQTLQLNGSLVNLGTQGDMLYDRAEKETISIELSFEKEKYRFENIKYQSDLTFFVNKHSFNKNKNSLDDIHNIEYISTDRIGPLEIYSKNITTFRNSLGFKGQYVFDYLLNDTSDLKVRINEWLSVISPGIKLDVTNIENTNLVRGSYSFSNLTRSKKPMNIGYGITHVLPVVVSLLKAKSGDVLIIENPELQIHPKGQKKLGELIALVVSKGVQIIIETHSDHLINGIRLAIKNKIISQNMCNVLFFNNDHTEGSSCSSIEFDQNGAIKEYTSNFLTEWSDTLIELLED